MVWKLFAGGHQQTHTQLEPSTQIVVRVLTHNIRYATSSPFKNEKPWKERWPLIVSQFQYHTRFYHDTKSAQNDDLTGTSSDRFNTSFICMQEVLHNQLSDILHSLNGNIEQGSRTKLPVWAYIGVGREDGKTKGEYSPILYPVQVFDLLHFENTWLSPTPNEPSKGWDAGSERILTTGVFEHKLTKKRVAVFNTHLDNAGPKSREKSVAIIIDIIERTRSDWANSTETSRPNGDDGLEYILTGDFNSFPTQEAYKAIEASKKMVDVHEIVPAAQRYGNEITFTGFEPDTDKDKDDIGRIDFIWLGPRSRVGSARSKDLGQTSAGWKVQGYAVLPNVFDDGAFCSDHRCVVVDAVLS